MNSFKNYWESRFDRDYSDGATGLDPFEGWERSRAPESRAEASLKEALWVLYSGRDSNLSLSFLQQCLSICQRIERETKLESELCRGGYPRNFGHFRRAEAYATGLTGNAFDDLKLAEGARTMVGWCDKVSWDHLAQAVYLGAVRMALVAGDLNLAGELLSTKRKFKYHQKEWELLLKLTRCGEGMGEEELLFGEVTTWFDTVRDPQYDPGVFVENDFLRLEWGLIRDKYFISDDGQIDWPRAVDAISA